MKILSDRQVNNIFSTWHNLCFKNNRSKKIFIIFLLLFVGVCSIFVLNQIGKTSDSINCFSVSLEDYTVTPFESDNQYYFVIPSYFKEKVSFNIDKNYSVFIDNKEVDNGGAFEYKLNQKYDFLVKEGFKTVINSKIYFLQSDVATIEIQTDSLNLEKINEDKDNSDSGQIKIIDSNGCLDYDGNLNSINGRGNASWSFSEKKPYNIELEEATSILKLNKGTTFSLISSGLDESQARNYLIYNIAESLNIPYAEKCEFSSLFINGEYLGLYLVVNKIDVSSSSIDINDLKTQTELVNPMKLSKLESFNFKENSSKGSYKGIIGNSPSDITGGYVLEMDTVIRNYPSASSGFVSNAGQALMIKSPKYATAEECKYISEFYQEFEDALLQENGINPTTLIHFSEYADLDSFARLYLIEEVFLNYDGGVSSIYLYKDKDENKIYAGPVWDYDATLGRGFNASFSNCDSIAYRSVHSNQFQIRDNEYRYLFSQLCNKKEFMDIVKSIYYDEFLKIYSDSYFNKKQDFINLFINDLNNNSIKWNSEEYSVEDNLQPIIDFANNRIEFLSDYYNNESNKHIITYKNIKDSTGTDRIYYYEVIDDGNKIELPEMLNENFDSWVIEETGKVISNDFRVVEDITIVANYKSSPNVDTSLKNKVISVLKSRFNDLLFFGSITIFALFCVGLIIACLNRRRG